MSQAVTDDEREVEPEATHDGRRVDQRATGSLNELQRRVGR
jgi:hypothetical protein